MASRLSTSMTEIGFANRSLPLFLTPEKKVRVGWTLMSVSAIIYLISNHFHFLVPQELPRSWVDQAIPLMPNSVWVYISEYFFFYVIYVTSDDMTNLNKFVYAFFTLQLTSCLIFWAWPTTYPRDLYPLPNGINPVTSYAFSLLRQTDTPANCCPSLHVSSVFLCSFIYLEEKRRYFPVFLAWAVAITISTLTTKQHYVIDAVAGLMMALAYYWFFYRYVHYKKVS